MMNAMIVSTQAGAVSALSELLIRSNFSQPVVCRSCVKRAEP